MLKPVWFSVWQQRLLLAAAPVLMRCAADAARVVNVENGHNARAPPDPPPHYLGRLGSVGQRLCAIWCMFLRERPVVVARGGCGATDAAVGLAGGRGLRRNRSGGAESLRAVHPAGGLLCPEFRLIGGSGFRGVRPHEEDLRHVCEGQEQRAPFRLRGGGRQELFSIHYDPADLNRVVDVSNEGRRPASVKAQEQAGKLLLPLPTANEEPRSQWFVGVGDLGWHMEVLTEADRWFLLCGVYLSHREILRGECEHGCERGRGEARPGQPRDGRWSK